MIRRINNIAKIRYLHRKFFFSITYILKRIKKADGGHELLEGSIKYCLSSLLTDFTKNDISSFYKVKQRLREVKLSCQF